MANLVVKKMGATWCAPCRALEPVLNELKGQYPNVSFQMIDVDDSPEVAEKYGVRNVPTVVIEKNGVEVKRLVGLQSKVTYTNAINENLA